MHAGPDFRYASNSGHLVVYISACLCVHSIHNYTYIHMVSPRDRSGGRIYIYIYVYIDIDIGMYVYMYPTPK